MAGELLAGERLRVRRAVRRVVLQAALLVAALTVALIGAGFLVASIYLYLRGVLGAWQAGLVTGGIAIVLALLILAIAAALRGRPARRAPPRPRPEQSETAAGLGRAAGEILSGTNLRTTDAAMIALVAGIALGMGARRGRGDSSGKDKKKE